MREKLPSEEMPARTPARSHQRVQVGVVFQRGDGAVAEFARRFVKVRSNQLKHFDLRYRERERHTCIPRIDEFGPNDPRTLRRPRTCHGG